MIRKIINKILNKRQIDIHKLVLTGDLYAVHKRDGKVVKDHGKIAQNVVTDTGVAFLVDAWQNSVELETMKYHGVGTGAGAELPANTALNVECTTQTVPDNTRATGTLAEGAANIFRTVGTVTFNENAAITEWGLFSQAAVGGGAMWDRALFAAINVIGASADSIVFTYDLTVTSGG